MSFRNSFGISSFRCAQWLFTGTNHTWSFAHQQFISDLLCAIWMFEAIAPALLRIQRDIRIFRMTRSNSQHVNGISEKVFVCLIKQSASVVAVVVVIFKSPQLPFDLRVTALHFCKKKKWICNNNHSNNNCNLFFRYF